MKDKKQAKLDLAKMALKEQGIYFIELANGQLQVDGINFWATKGKWYNPKTGEKGEGLHSFISHIRGLVQ